MRVGSEAAYYVLSFDYVLAELLEYLQHVAHLLCSR